MPDLTFTKNDFNIEKINTIIENYCTLNSIKNENLFKMQLVAEEFLSNILFPNFEDTVDFSISQKYNDTLLSFSYIGADFMNKINETTMLSLKILQNKTKDIKSLTKENKTIVEFLV